MNWNTATPEQIHAKIEEAIRLGRGITVSAAWLKRMLSERALMAILAKCQDEPQFDNPLHAMAAQGLRDRILQEKQS